MARWAQLTGTTGARVRGPDWSRQPAAWTGVGHGLQVFLADAAKILATLARESAQDAGSRRQGPGQGSRQLLDPSPHGSSIATRLQAGQVDFAHGERASGMKGL
ncbi:MAG: hypothetical protein EA417_07170 [Gammaproteobacteria bacterium]|nr:MAG: hypothetical protein EA417_07170 [Gammaproteobacteria bacterium]